MTARPATPDVVQLRDLTDVAAAVPYFLGFHPTESVVAAALCGRRERIGFTMRLDLLDPEHDADVATMIGQRMVLAEAVAVLLFVYTSAPREPGGLPRRGLVEAVAATLSVDLRDAVLVDQARVWSYLCDEPSCCPPEGRPMRPGSTGALALAAAHALRGNVVLADRDALVATTTRVGGVAAVSMQQAAARALDELAATSGDDDALVASMALVDRLCAEFAEGPGQLSHDDAAVLMLRVHRVSVRDALVGRLARGDDAAARLVAELARLAQPPHDAPAATMLAMSAYFRGDGVVAVAAAERALGTDPDYSLARLLMDAISGQLHPDRMRRIWARHRA